MSEKVELKVNVINQLKLLRQSTFKDMLCFLDEDIQNAQRAKAKNVYVTIEGDSIIIENDGAILDNPQALFSIAESGWDNDVKETENPFGMGFFSNITVSNFIEIYSGTKHVIFDVDKMINTNDTEIHVEEVEESLNGFKLILNNFDFSAADRYDIRERVEQLGKYIQELNIYYNGQLQEKRDLTESDGNSFEIKVEEEGYVGWIALAGNYGFGDSLNVFYKGRLVKKLESTPYIKGDIHISDKALNLTSPDRKDIIKDSKYSKFREELRIHIRLLCEDALLNGDEAEVENFASAIGYYINTDTIKNKIKFLTLKGKDSFGYIEKIALARKADNKINSYKDYQLYLKKESSIQPESHFEEVEIKEDIVSDVPEARGVISHDSSSSYSGGYLEKPEIKKESTEEKKGECIIDNQEAVFWMNFNEIEVNEYKFNIIKHYGLRLIISRNKAESEVLKAMKETDKVFHISELNEDISVKGTLNNTELSLREQRAMMILELISRILGFNHNVFAIGDLMVVKEISIESLNVTKEVVEESITVLRNSGDKKVYVDRSVVNLSDLVETLDTTITVKDYKFILTNLYSIVDQSYLISKDIGEDGNKKDYIMRNILTALGQGIL